MRTRPLLLLTLPLLLIGGWPGEARAQQGQAGADEAQAAPQLAKPPKLVELVPADIPEGTEFPAEVVEVLVELEVSTEGTVSSATVKRGPGEPFDSAAQAAARQFRFEPALLTTGEAVPVTVSLTVKIPRPKPLEATPAEPGESKEPEEKQPEEPKKPAVKPVRFGGELLERGTRKPLDGVEVSALSDGEVLASAVTDGQGRFSLEVPATRFELRAIPQNHQPLAEMVTAKPGEQREERFYLEETSTGFVTVVVSDKVKREVTKQVLPKEVVEKIPGTTGDALKVIQILPGVSRAPRDAGLVVLRGASPGDSRVFLEGQEIPILYHFGGLRSTFNSVFLEAVEFIPGNFGPEFGRAIGGVIDVKVRDPASDMIRGMVDINLYDASIALEGPLSENWSMGGAFRRSWIDTFVGAVVPDDAGVGFDSLPRFYDYQLLASWKPDANKRLRFIWNGSMDKVIVLFDRPASDPAIRGNIAARIMFHTLYAGYFHRFTPKLSQDTSLQVGYQEISTELGPNIFFDLGVTRFSVRSTWTYELMRMLAFRAGLDIRVDYVNIAFNSSQRPIEGENPPPVSTDQTRGLEKDTTLYNPAAWLETQFKPMDSLLFFLSVRFDWYREIERLTVDPRLTVRYTPLDGTTIKAGFGAYHQPPTADQSDPDTGNPALRAPGSMHASLGAEQRIWKNITAEVTGFYKWLDSQVIRNPAYFTDPRLPPYLSGGTGRIFGVELLVRANIAERFQGWLSYTFQRSFRTDGPDAEERIFSYDQPHILSVAGTYFFGSGWSAGLRFRLVSGNPITPVTGSIYDTGAGTYVPIYGPTNSDRAELFHQLDLRVDKEFTFKTWRLALYLDIQNVYYHQNQEGVSYNFDYSESQVMGGLPILPIIGIRGSF